MSHWAQLSEDNIVINVLRGDNEDPNGDEGYQWLIDNLGGRWIKTSYNSNIRKNYAGIGYIYDEERDAFIPPIPYSKWLLNEDTCLWEAPIPYPEDDKHYIWNDNKGEWEEISQ